MKDMKQIHISTSRDGSPCGELDYAAQEIRHFLNEYTTVSFTENKNESGALIELCIDTSMKPHCYSVKGDGTVLKISGGNASSVLCGVYEALEGAGLLFDADGALFPIHSGNKKFETETFLRVNKKISPKCRLRGVRQHINFPMDISSYSLKEAKEYIRSIARMRFNAITFHSYGGQWHSTVPGDPAKQAGHFFYGQYHQVPEDPVTAARIHNRKTYCIPEAEAIYGDDSARAEYARYWLNEVMKTAKEAYMTITLSVELPFDDEERLTAMLYEVCLDYPLIDTLELISFESGGGARIADLTRENVVEIMAGMFGSEILNEDGSLPGLGSELPKQLGGAAVSLKRMLTAISVKEKWLDGLKKVPALRTGLYITCQDTLKILWPIMRRLVPADISRSLLPAHGSLAVANMIEAIGTSESDWQNTMYYSWAEFDGNMYIQQLSTNGIEKLLSLTDAESIFGFCINHWRTAENRITIAYAAEAAVRPVTAAGFYHSYAVRLGITQTDRFAAVCDRLAALDAYCRDNLFNIGFCYVNCWFHKGDIVRPRGYSKGAQEYAISEYEGIAGTIEHEILPFAVTKEAIALLRLFINRCKTSALHIRSMLVLHDIYNYYDYDHPSALTDDQEKAIRGIISRSQRYAWDYIHLYGELLPDRGCEGLIVSYCVTVPVFIDAVAGNFISSIQVEQTEHFDAPPAPDAESR